MNMPMVLVEFVCLLLSAFTQIFEFEESELIMRWSFIDSRDEQFFMGLDMNDLDVDEFYIKFNNNLTNHDTRLYKLHKDCVECPYVSSAKLFNSKNGSSELFSITKIYSTNLKFRITSGYSDKYLPQDETKSVICNIDKNFGQFGVYNVDINEAGCQTSTLKEPVNIYTPIITVFLIYASLFAVLYGVVYFWKKWSNQKESKDKEQTPKKVRIKSLDTFRGITIVLMIFANFGCGGYHFIEHTTWNGLHVADLVFPCFIWIMGACIPMSLSSSFKKGLSNKTIFLTILKRSIKLFCLGIFLGSGSNLPQLRIFGVLQRFGIAYLVVTTICLFFMKRSPSKEGKFKDILILTNAWLFALALLIIHTIIIFFVAAPKCPKGYMGPGGLHKNRSYTECIGGATGYIDKVILGKHAYQYPTIGEIYESAPFDPEGILGCLTTIVHVFFGVQAGVTLSVYKNHFHRILRWLLWGVVCGLISGGLCGFSKEDGVIPVNKNLWSLSFVLITTCFAFTLLTICYILVDLKKWWSGKPFLFAGMNAILMYIGHEMTDGHFPVRWSIGYEGKSERNTHFEALLSDTWGTGESESIMKWSFIDGRDERYFMGLNMHALNADEFYVKFNNNMTNTNTYLYKLHKDCIECPYVLSGLLSNPNDDSSESIIKTKKFSTHFKFRIAFVRYSDSYLPLYETKSIICDIDNKYFGQFGVYNININKEGCQIRTLKEPVNIYTPMITVFLIYAFLFAVLYGAVYFWKKRHCKKESEDKERSPKKDRIKSLDTFRGIIIVVMIFANFGSGAYHSIKHTTWNGLHLADLVFPCFIWIMGACIPMSLNSKFKKGLSDKVIFLTILKRSIKLFSLGIFLGSGSNLNYLRIFGVPQRLGIGYLVVTTICLFFMKRSSKDGKFEYILILTKGWLFALAFLTIHTIIIFFVAAPGCPKGYMGPGGLHKNRYYVKCIGGITGYIDHLILGSHAKQYPTIREVYESMPFDPEGILGCLTTIVHVFFGVQAGVILSVYKKHSQRILRWLLWGVGCGLIGGALCGFSKEDGFIPINKNLWSISFVLVTTCLAFTLLTICYILVDLKRWWSGKPFLFAGMNAILMYIGHIMTDRYFPVRWYIERDTHFEALLSDTWGAGIWVLVSYYLYKINYFFTV